MHSMRCIVNAIPWAWQHSALRFSTGLLNMLVVSGGARFQCPWAPFLPINAHGAPVIRPRRYRGPFGVHMPPNVRGVLGGGFSLALLGDRGALSSSSIPVSFLPPLLSFGAFAVVANAPLCLVLALSAPALLLPGITVLSGAANPLSNAVHVEPAVAAAAPCHPPPLVVRPWGAGFRDEGGCGGGKAPLRLSPLGLDKSGLTCASALGLAGFLLSTNPFTNVR